MRLEALDKIDSNLYKGLGILLIVTHNFMHLFPKPRENQFDFYLDRTHDFLLLTYTEPENILRILLSFFGHFGVQIFVFLSAYGLSVKHLQQKPEYWQFLWQRMIRVYPAFLLAILLWICIEGWIIGGYGILGPVKVLFWSLDYILLKVLLISNFMPGQSLQPIGPWWFIPFIFQFYVVFPLLRHLYAVYGNLALLTLSVASILLSILTGGKIGDLNIYYTVIGHFPVFCIGIYLANNAEKEVTFPNLFIYVALGMYILGNFYEIFWHFSHLAFFLLLLLCFSALTRYLKTIKAAKRVVLFFGGLSMQLFLVNGFLREPYFYWAETCDHWLLTIALCIASLATSTVVALLLTAATNRLMLNVNADSPASLYADVRSNLERLLTIKR